MLSETNTDGLYSMVSKIGTSPTLVSKAGTPKGNAQRKDFNRIIQHQDGTIGENRERWNLKNIVQN